jgi:hypothetical protein
LGRQKVGDVQIFLLWLWMHFSTAFLAFKAFALASALGGAGASFFAFGAILAEKNLFFFFFFFYDSGFLFFFFLFY